MRESGGHTTRALAPFVLTLHSCVSGCSDVSGFSIAVFNLFLAVLRIVLRSGRANDSSRSRVRKPVSIRPFYQTRVSHSIVWRIFFPAPRRPTETLQVPNGGIRFKCGFWKWIPERIFLLLSLFKRERLGEGAKRASHAKLENPDTSGR